MIYPLSYPQAKCAAPLFAQLIEHNLVLASILAGNTPAVIYADDPLHPCVAFTWFKYRAFLAGRPQSPAFTAELARLLSEQLIPAARHAGIDACLFNFSESEWVDALPQLLHGLKPIETQRQFYTCRSLPVTPTLSLPPGSTQLYSTALYPTALYSTALPVDADLLARDDLQRINELREETCSEAVSIEHFLAHSFGYCLTYQDELVCWCLSEYNTDGHCEVGVATAEPYRRRGLATITTHALLEHAFRLGYTQVGWHCWASNTPSAALARKAGFTLEKEDSVYLYPTLAVK